MFITETILKISAHGRAAITHQAFFYYHSIDFCSQNECLNDHILQKIYRDNAHYAFTYKTIKTNQKQCSGKFYYTYSHHVNLPYVYPSFRPTKVCPFGILTLQQSQINLFQFQHFNNRIIVYIIFFVQFSLNCFVKVTFTLYY